MKLVFSCSSLNFAITDTKVYVPVVTLSTQDNIKLLKKLETGFKRIPNWNKCLPKTSTGTRNKYLDFLTDAIFQGVNRLLVLSFKDEGGRKSRKSQAILSSNCGNKRL